MTEPNHPIEQAAFARAGLLGNPSDGYNGKTISIIAKNFSARVRLEPSDKLVIVPGLDQGHQFPSPSHLTKVIQENGYYGGVRLVKAAIKNFVDYAARTNQPLHSQNFSISYISNIPRQVGLAGSSAITMAALRGLMEWYQVQIPPYQLASLTLAAESDLGIPAGLQDRVIQAYEGMVFMDFSVDQMKTENGLRFGCYEPLNPALLPNIYIAYAHDAGEPTEVLHNDLRQRFQAGQPDVVQAMSDFAAIAEQGKQALLNGDHVALGKLIDQNFDLRNQICQLHPEHCRMIETARAVGASAKYCGSGGAIIGTYSDEAMFAQLSARFQQLGCTVIAPIVDHQN